MTFRTFAAAIALTAGAALTSTAQAEETDPPKALTVSGTAGFVSDYRFRGVSQSDLGFAAQAGVTITHKSGFYAGVWGSNLAGWGQFGGTNTELDVIGGFKTEIASGTTIDVGLTWYMYPAGADKTDFGEPYVKLSSTLGPASVTAGVAYAPKQEALGRWYLTAASNATGKPDFPGAKDDNLYIWGDVSGGIPGTPVTLKAHLGYSDGNPGLGPNGTSVAPTGKYFDWLIGADVAVLKNVTLGVAYIDTDISDQESAYLKPNFSRVRDGKSIAGSTLLVSGTVAF